MFWFSVRAGGSKWHLILKTVLKLSVLIEETHHQLLLHKYQVTLLPTTMRSLIYLHLKITNTYGNVRTKSTLHLAEWYWSNGKTTRVELLRTKNQAVLCNAPWYPYKIQHWKPKPGVHFAQELPSTFWLQSHCFKSRRPQRTPKENTGLYFTARLYGTPGYWQCSKFYAYVFANLLLWGKHWNSPCTPKQLTTEPQTHMHGH